MTPSRVRPLLPRSLFLAFAAVVAVIMLWTYVGLLHEAVARGAPWHDAAPAAKPAAQVEAPERG